jgi:hypothetical protein
MRPNPTNQTQSARSLAGALIGRSFVHPLVDYLLIGGGLSLIVTAIVLAEPGRGAIIDLAALPYFILLSNSAHFASSTVRLYTKPGTFQALPFLTTAFPLLFLVLLAVCLSVAGYVGPHLLALYLTWSPFHYAAQGYGLALVYAYRSGCQILPADKKLLFWTSLLPFFYAFVGLEGTGLHWLLPASVFQHPQVHAPYSWLIFLLPYVSMAAVLLLYLKVARSASGPLPIISVLMLVANAAWWCFLPQDAFVWATIFHGIQYLGIVTIFHVKDQLARPDNRLGWPYHVASFYGGSLLLGYGLFSCLPWGFEMAGFGMVESIALCVAAINIHHFVVDAYIWRLKKGDRNRAIVESAQSETSAAEVSAVPI